MLAAQPGTVKSFVSWKLNPSVLFTMVDFSLGNSTRSAGNYVVRESRMLKKLMTGSNRPRKKWFKVDQPVSKALEEFSFMSQKGSKSKSTPTKPIRRVEVLNTVFMEYITGMMATGDVGAKLVGRGIEVTRVKISNDFSCVNVYWAAKGTDADQSIEGLLRQVGGELRHECSKLRIIGVVPPINFVKDKTFSKYNEVETLLAKCDFGEDFVPTASRLVFTQSSPRSSEDGNEMSPNFSINLSKIENVISQSNSGGASVGDYFDKTVDKVEVCITTDSNMRQDILGLNRNRIMEMIIQEMTRNTDKLKAKQKYMDSVNEDSALGRFDQSLAANNMTTHAEIVKEKREEKDRHTEFSKYLKQMRIRKAKEERLLSTAAKEKEFYDSERQDRLLQSIESGNEFDNEEDDYEETVQTFEEYSRHT